VAELDNEISLSEVWSPARQAPHLQGPIGTYYQDIKTNNSPSYVLELNQDPFYHRRKNLHGVHFVVTSINVSKTVIFLFGKKYLSSAT